MSDSNISLHRQAGPIGSFARDESAAVASTFAIAMFALVGIAGVAWDWTRMTALDSELQNAADQAALAAATQLDGKESAIDRATAAASGLVANVTLMANDGEGTALTVAEDGGLVFYEGYDQLNDSFESTTTDDADARVVTVTVAPREAFFVLTPVVGIFRSNGISAKATASLGSAICNTPPVMICDPLEDDGGEFNPADYIGVGLKLLTDNGTGAPGNFGFLSNGLDNGTPQLATNLGHDILYGNCQSSSQVLTEPGQKDVVFNAINTRFDLDIAGANSCPDGDANCTAAPISRKDLVKQNDNGSNCGYSRNSTGASWQQPSFATRYAPPSARNLTTTEQSQVKFMGYPRDLCHAWSEAGDCSEDDQGLIGNGQWDRDTFFKVNYNWTPSQWQTNTGLGSNATRYEVYDWETKRLAAGALASTERKQTFSGKSAIATPVCRAPGNPQRRVMTAAVIKCGAEGVSGRDTANVSAWVEFFLVEPSVYREDRSFEIQNNGNLKEAPKKLTDDNQVYVEIIRAVDVGGDGGSGEVVRRDVPYLIR